MILAQTDWGVGQVFWSILWFFLFVAWISLLIRVFADIMRARELSGWAKALWTVAIIVLPFIGVFLYLIVNGDNMNRRDVDVARAADEATREYIRQAAGGSNTGDQLHKLADLHSSGKLSDAEYEQAKSEVIHG